MFNTRDFIDYFTEIEMIERNMRDLYGAALESITNTDVREVIEGINIEEIKHVEIVDEIRQIAIKNSLIEK